MRVVFKVLVYLVLVAVVGLVGIAVFSDLAPERHAIELPVEAP